MNKTANKQLQRTKRHARIRSRVKGTAETPRLAVFRSNKYIYAQLIDDVSGTTLGSADARKTEGSATERAAKVGTAIAEVAKAAGIEKVVFDRGGFKYQGAVAALADGAREAGLQF